MLYLDLGLSTPRRGPVAYLPRWALLAQLPWRGLNRPYAEYRIMPSKMRARRRSRRRTPRRPPGPARRRLYPGTLDRRSGGATRQSDSAFPGQHAGSASGANPGTVRFSLEYRTGPALAEEPPNVRIEYPVHSLPLDARIQRVQRLMRAASRPKPLGLRPSLRNLRRDACLFVWLLHRYYGAVRLLPGVYVRIVAIRLSGPICFRRHQGGLPVLVHIVSRRAWGLRLRRARPW